MKILLVAATHNEIAPYLSSPHKHNVLITGVGVPEATYSLTRHLAHHRYDIVIQAGIAGANVNTFPLGSLVAVSKDCFAGLGAWQPDGFADLQSLGLNNEPLWYKGSETWIAKTKLPAAEAATVSTLTDHENYLQAQQSKWPHGVESMEGAALYYVCHQLHQPALQIRCISNAIGDRNKANWNIAVAIANLNDYLQHWLSPLES